MSGHNEPNNELLSVKSTEPNLKYYGLFGNEEFELVNQSLLEKLLFLGVFKENDTFKNDSEYLNDFRIGETSFSDGFSFEIRFSFEGKFYELTGAIIDELFNVCKYYVENYMIDVESELNDSFYELNKFLNKKDKIKFLQKKYKEVFPSDKIQEFAIFKGEGVSQYIDSDTENWREYFEDKITWFPEILKIYLTMSKINNEVSSNICHYIGYTKHLASDKIEDKDYPLLLSIMRNLSGPCIDKSFLNFLDTWKTFYQKEIALNLISNKIKELEEEINNTTQNATPPLPPKEKLTLKKLFIDQNLCKGIIDKLIDKNIIREVSGEYEIIIPKKYERRGYQSFICSIGMQLHDKGYLHSHYDGEAISNAFNNTFKNVSITRKNYGSLKESSNQEEYLKYTHFIPRNIN